MSIIMNVDHGRELTIQKVIGEVFYEEIITALINYWEDQPTKNLFAITELNLKAEHLDIRTIKAGKDEGYLGFALEPKIDPKIIIKLIQEQPETYKLEGPHKLKFRLETKRFY